ncbi:hypothetical protein IFM89_016678 [Coptis chinensis]|uniref:Uncharacterized protein n=1 Tax=Coptis chinensis TaxID=261450 RepID=A0A835IPM1_9MAGN|nr:hypothetical protein IFM89_016678 [Coptis chinensis]
MPISSKGNLFLISFILLLSLSSSSHYLVHGSPVPYKHIYNRPDPFSHHFKSYHGSYNITDIHYWSSAAFTGVHGYAMACIWILGGLGLGVYILVRNLSCTTSSPSSAIVIRRPSDFYRFIPLVVVVLCTFLAMDVNGGLGVGLPSPPPFPISFSFPIPAPSPLEKQPGIPMRHTRRTPH